MSMQSSKYKKPRKNMFVPLWNGMGIVEISEFKIDSEPKWNRLKCLLNGEGTSLHSIFGAEYDLSIVTTIWDWDTMHCGYKFFIKDQIHRNWLYGNWWTIQEHAITHFNICIYNNNLFSFIRQFLKKENFWWMPSQLLSLHWRMLPCTCHYYRHHH